MTKVHHLMALLSFSRTFAPALGHVNSDYGYGDPILLQPTVTATVTTTQISTVTVDGNTCDAVYTPTTVTVYTSCSSTSDASGLPLSSYSSHGPWINATFTSDVPCTHDLSTSTAVPSNFSSSMGWNHTTATSLPTLTGTAGTTIETADPIGTSSVRWANSTRSSTAEEDWTSVITLTVTSSAMITANATMTSGYSAPSSGFSTGTGLPGHESSEVPPSYHLSLTYQTTTRANPSTEPSGIPTNETATNTWPSAPPSWNISTISNLPTSTISNTPTNTTSHTILTAETNDPLFTDPTSSPIPTWSNTTLTPPWPTTSLISLTPTTTTTTTTTTNDDDAGGNYGSYSYPSPSPSPSSSASTVDLVDPIEGTATATATTTPTPTFTLTLTRTDVDGGGGGGASSLLSTPTTLLTVTSSRPADGSTTTDFTQPGYGYGYGYGY
ncbi:hypothetical protein F5144DRAFT_610113 [Chaetomium tenue]|uniref:Uncharacterized protein n=1 Tax=Chaetomium tenue TaxID=1854479 RepID=A0ACB7PI73_9PEZI|nr:hypothetical protein F5144DRAFT_610113 [Chaetomium globosum]